jgi:putative spermidine/putrescine transport system permease protein
LNPFSSFALFKTIALGVFLFLPAPIFIVVLSSFAKTGYLTFPPKGLSLRWYEEFLASDAWLTALAISTVIAVFVAILTTTLSFLAAFAAIRREFRGKALLNIMILSPLLFPHAAIAVALLGVLSWWSLSGSYVGIAVAHAILCVPFAYQPILNSMRGFDLAYEEAGMMLGATPIQVFRKVTLPVLRPGITTALIFSFIISFDEATVTVFLLGPDVVTLPTRIFSEIQESGSPVVAAISSFLVVLSIIIVYLLKRMVGLEFFVSSRGRT